MDHLEHVLHVGPGCVNHRGGIGAVLAIYKNSMQPFQYISTYTYRNKLIEPFFFAAALVKIAWTLLMRRRINIVHIHGAKDGSTFRKFLIFFVAKNIYRKKIIFHIHAGAFVDRYEQRGRCYGLMCRFLVNKSDAVVALSENLGEALLKYFAPKKLVVIVNPIDRRNFAPKKTCDGQAVVFLFLGAIVEKKGVFDLIEVIRTEQQSLRGKCKFLIGGHRETARLQRLISEAGIDDLVEYIGWVQDDRREHFMRLTDYFILPTYEDAMPMTILEAFSCGKPVVTTLVGSIPEIVHDHTNGRLFTPGDLGALTQILFELVNDRSNYELMCSGARESVGRFDVDKVMAELECLYAGIS